MSHDHQPVDLGAIGRVEFGERGFGATDDLHLGAEDFALDALVRDLAILGIHHRDRHLDSLGLAAADFDRLAGCRRLDDRLKRGNTVDDLVGSDRIGPHPADRGGKTLELGL